MLIKFCIFLFVTILAVVVAVLLGESGPWYLSWVLGTGFMILVSSMGAILLDAQEEDEAEAAKTTVH